MEFVNLSAHADIPQADLRHFWNYIGYDECNFTHMPHGMELIRKFGKFEQPYYFRAHHMLCTGNLHGLNKWGSTNIYSEDADGNPVYDFTCIDKMFDIWIDAGNLPFFEIGFMPRDLARLPEDGKPYSDGSYRSTGWAMPPKDWQKWYDLIYALMAHLKDRCGEDGLKRWYFELWNEPDIIYWRGTHEEYCKLFDYTEAAIHSVLPDARFGGPATTGNNTYDSSAAVYLRDFLRHCREGENFYSGKTGTRLDFTSFHTKGGLYNMNLKAAKQIPSVQVFLQNCKVLSDIIKEEGYGGLECVVSEADPDSWAAGGRYDNFNLNFRNTEYYASWVASTYKNLQDLADGQGVDMRPLAWAFEFEPERCFEGTRAFTTQGIEKPLFNLFKCYTMLGSKRIALESSRGLNPLDYTDKNGYDAGTEINGWATQRDDGSYAILLYAHHDDWDIDDEYAVHFTLDGLDSNAVRLTHYRIDGTHSNAHTEWKRQGSPDWPDDAQMQAIKAREGLELLCEPYVKSACDGTVEMDFVLPCHGVSLILAEPVGK